MKSVFVGAIAIMLTVAGAAAQGLTPDELAARNVQRRAVEAVIVENRPKSWSTWVTFSVSSAAPAPAATKPIVRKY